MAWNWIAYSAIKAVVGLWPDISGHITKDPKPVLTKDQEKARIKQMVADHCKKGNK